MSWSKSSSIPPRREERGVVAVGLAAVHVDGLVVGELWATVASLEVGFEEAHGALQVLHQIHDEVAAETCQWEEIRTSDEVLFVQYFTYEAKLVRRSGRWGRASPGP